MKGEKGRRGEGERRGVKARAMCSGVLCSCISPQQGSPLLLFSSPHSTSLITLPLHILFPSFFMLLSSQSFHRCCLHLILVSGLKRMSSQKSKKNNGKGILEDINSKKVLLLSLLSRTHSQLYNHKHSNAHSHSLLSISPLADSVTRQR